MTDADEKLRGVEGERTAPPPTPEQELRLTQAELDAMPEYSTSLPTGQTFGKRWKRRIPYKGEPFSWWVGEYYDSKVPGQVGINWYRVVIAGVRGEETTPDATPDPTFERLLREFSRAAMLYQATGDDADNTKLDAAETALRNQVARSLQEARAQREFEHQWGARVSQALADAEQQRDEALARLDTAKAHAQRMSAIIDQKQCELSAARSELERTREISAPRTGDANG